MNTVAKKSEPKLLTYGIEFLFNDNGTECGGTDNLPLEEVRAFAISDLAMLGGINQGDAMALVDEMLEELAEDEKIMSVKIDVPSSKATFEITRKLF